MEKSLKRQRGLGWFGLLFVFGTIGFVALVVIKVAPLYSNQFVLSKAVHAVANDPELGSAEVSQVRRALESRWAVDYISQVDDRDIKLKRDERGRYLEYDYEARVNLFYNVFVVIHFQGKEPMRNSANAPADY